jgi:hypothetical protein
LGTGSSIETVTRSTETLTEAGRQVARLDQLGLHLLATTEVLGTDCVPYTLDAAARVRQAHQLASGGLCFA